MSAMAISRIERCRHGQHLSVLGIALCAGLAESQAGQADIGHIEQVQVSNPGPVQRDTVRRHEAFTFVLHPANARLTILASSNNPEGPP